MKPRFVIRKRGPGWWGVEDRDYPELGRVLGIRAKSFPSALAYVDWWLAVENRKPGYMHR